MGVIIDSKLNFSAHIKYCLNKLNKCLWAICKLRHYTNTKTLKLIYFSLAYPFLQYCISTWGGTSKSLLKPLFIKQKIIVRTILNKPYRSPSTPLFYNLKILKLEDIYKLQIGKLMHKHHTEKIVMTDNLTYLATIHNHNTRSQQNKNFYLPYVRTNLGKTSFYFNGPKIWNNFPAIIRNSSKFIFKNSLKEYLLQSYLCDLWNYFICIYVCIVMHTIYSHLFLKVFSKHLWIVIHVTNLTILNVSNAQSLL